MNKNMINLGNVMNPDEVEMPHGTMINSMGNLVGQIPTENNEMPSGNEEMPSGEMNGAFNTILEEIQTGVEMPTGEMIESTGNFGEQLPSDNSEMPAGIMADTNSSFSDEKPSGGVEMPAGNMNDSASGANSAQAKVYVIDIPGTWKIQLISKE